MLRSWRFAFFAFPVAAALWNGAAQGAVIAQYSFTGSTLNATTAAGSVMAGSITASPNVNGQATSTLAFANNVGYASQPTLAVARANTGESATRANVYFQFAVAANAEMELDLSTLTFKVAQGGASGPRDYDVRSSIDGYASSLTGGVVNIPTVRPTFTPVSINLSGSQFQDLPAITFRVYVFTPGVSQNVDFDDITLNGEAVAAVPEPSALAVLAAGGWMLGRRRRAV
jgi:hypothetical protein